MKSPRFTIRADRLKLILKPENLRRTWKDKVRLAMRSQYLCDPIENFDFHVNVDLECNKIYDAIMRGEYAPNGGHRILSEKSKGLCRQIVIPHAQDALVLQCLSDAMYAKIKGSAPTNKAFFEPKDHGFSKNSKSEYGTFASWLNFQKEIFKFSQNRNFVVVTDIANYYDTISYVHLRNIIAGIDGMEECVLDMLIYVLSELLWRPDYMPRTEIGLPQIDLDAPRLLAHCFLYELDEYVSIQSSGDFTRFMDDIDVGVDTINDAKRVLRGIDLVLQTRQIRLNSGKTRILTKSEAMYHFRIWDNVKIDAIDQSATFALSAGISLDNIRKNVLNLIYSGIKKKKFDDGNGEKILKRLIGLAGKVGADIQISVISKILFLRPSVREPLYLYISRSKLTPARARTLSEFVRSGIIVDHVAYVEMVNVMVETLVETSSGIHLHVKAIWGSIKDDDYFGLYAAIWLMSKYANPAGIIMLLQEKKKMWFGDERLGRLVGGLHPIFFNTTQWESFLALISESRNDGCRVVYKFHDGLRNNVASFNKMKPFLDAPNSSKLTGINHAKFLCLVSSLGNSSIDEKTKSKLVV